MPLPVSTSIFIVKYVSFASKVFIIVIGSYLILILLELLVNSGYYGNPKEYTYL